MPSALCLVWRGDHVTGTEWEMEKIWVFVCSSWGIPAFISCFLSVFPWNSTSCPLLFTYLLIISWPNPPSLPPSSVFFPLSSLSNLLTQSLNLLEPRDLVCYVNGETKTHMCSHIWTCLLPVRTHAHTCSVLGFAAFGRRSAFLLLTRWCSVYKNCQSRINQSFALWAQHIRGSEEVCWSGYTDLTDLTTPRWQNVP